MLIEYCDKCGMRIPEKEIQEGRAVRMDERLYCAKCCPAPATKAVPKVKHTSEAKILLATPRPPQQPISDGSLKAYARGARAHDPRSDRAPASRQEGQSKPMLAGIIAAVAGVLLLAVIFMGGSKPDQARNTKPEAPDIPKASENPPSSSSSSSPPGSTSVRRPNPPRSADVVPPAGATPPPSGAGREDQAEKAYAALLAEIADLNAFSRKAKLKEFIDTYQDTIIAARARVELARLESPQASPVQQVATTPAAAAGGTTYVLQQGLDGYTGCEDTFLYTNHPKISKYKEIEMSCGRGMVPVMHFAIFKSEGGPVPNGARILSAKLNLVRTLGDPMELFVYPVLKDCQLAAATWEEAAPGLAWDEAGAAAKGKDYGDQPLAMLPVDRDMTALELDLTEAVRKLTAGEKNRGWVLHGGRNNWNFYSIYSSESAETDKRPQLTVEVAGGAQPVAVAGAPTDGLILYLPFDDKEGNVAKDASGANNNGQVSGGVRWTEGKVGGALRLDGTGRVTLGRLAVNAQARGKNTVAFWARFEELIGMPFTWSDTGDLFFVGDRLGFNTLCGELLAAMDATPPKNAWCHIVAVFTNDTPNEQNVAFYLNGKRQRLGFLNESRPGRTIQATPEAAIGSRYAMDQYGMIGAVDDLRLYNREVTEAEVAVLYAAGTGTAAAPAPPKVGSAPTDGLILYLPFDEKEGTVAKDASGANNNGQILGSVNWTEGKVGGALRLDGATGRVEVRRMAVNTKPGARNTVAMWVHAEFSNSMTFCWAGLGDLLFAQGGFGFNTYNSDQLGVSTDEFKANDWNHVVAVFPNDVPTEQNATLYVNGKRMPIASRLAATPGGAVSASEDATIGAFHGKLEYFLRGAVDEFRVYNRELSEAEVAALHSAGSASAVPEASAKVALSGPAQDDGLILHLPFRKGGAEFTQDISGKGCTVQLMNGAEPLTASRGVSLNFPPGNGYAVVQGLARDAKADARHTVTFWMYPRAIVSGMPFAWKDQSYCLYLTPNGFGINTGESGNILGVDGTRIKPKEWVHVAAVFPNGVPNLDNIALYLDGKRTAEKLAIAPMPAQARSATQGIYLGGIPTGSYYFNGILQDVRVYNRELADEEVKAVFENKPLPPRSAPAPAVSQDLVLHLPFDEKSGDVAKDASGNGHDAALKNGPQFGAGRIGGALKFDGTDDYAEIPDFDYGPEFTLAFWFNIDPSPRARYQYLFGHGVYDKTNSCLVYVDLQEKKLRTYLRDGNDGHIVREYDIPYDGLGNWIHYAVQVTREEGLKIFLDGKLLKTGRHGKKGITPKTALTLGIRWDLDRERIFTGALDDLRLYNRALSDDEIAALAGSAAPASAGASVPAAPTLSAEDKALDERLKRWRVLWGAGETKSLRDDIEALRKEGGAAAEQAAVCEAALAARDAAWKQAAALVGKPVRLALAHGDTQAGKIERLDGDRFEFNLGGLVTRYQLGDLAWEAFRGWAEANLAGDAEKQKKLAAAALLTAGVDAEKEADAALRTAWTPLFASAVRVDADLRNDAVWAEILGLVKVQKWQEVYGKAQGLLDAPPGGRLSAELKEKVERLLAETKSSIQAELSKPENLPLQVRAKALGDGKLELRYDFSNPRQLQDWEGLDAAFMRIESGALNLSAMQIQHKLNFEGDLTISYEAASTAAKPYRLCTAFYDLRGEIGFEGKDETAFWHALNQPGKTVMTNPLVGKQWNRVDIQFTAATKQTRIAVNGTECMSSQNPSSAGRGQVMLAAYHPYRVRNLVISGKPAPNATESALHGRAFAEALQKKLAHGETVPVFTAEDQRNWDMGLSDSWRFASGVASGEGTVSLPGLALRDYEAEMDVRLVDADKFRVVVRQGPRDRYHVLVTSRGVSIYSTDRLANYAGKEIGKPNSTDGRAWHHLTIQSKGSALKIVLDGKDVLFDDQQISTESMGFYFQTEGGKASIRNVKFKALR